MSFDYDLVASGLIGSYNRPDANVTGIYTRAARIDWKAPRAAQGSATGPLAHRSLLGLLRPADSSTRRSARRICSHPDQAGEIGGAGTTTKRHWRARSRKERARPCCYPPVPSMRDRSKIAQQARGPLAHNESNGSAPRECKGSSPMDPNGQDTYLRIVLRRPIAGGSQGERSAF